MDSYHKSLRLERNARTYVIPRRKSEIDTVEKKSAVTIRRKPAFRPIVEVATTCEGSGISLINQTPQTQESKAAILTEIAVI